MLQGKGYNDKEASAEKPDAPRSKEFPSIRIDKTQNMDEDVSNDKKPEKVDNCVTWSKNMLETAHIHVFTQEYQDNRNYDPQVSYAISQSQHAKNRYKQIYCADENRVILQDRDKKNDYIHASWMKMPDDVKYISTQGPIERTLEDFWHMIYTENAPAIVMLCNYIEDEKEKCERYFDADKEQKFGEYMVKVVEKTVDLFKPVKYTVIQVTKKDGEPHLVHHYWYHEWYDQTAPLDPIPMVNLYRTVLKKVGTKPTVVHCSAGIGRTSTFVGIHFAYCMILDNPNVGMVEILRKLRKMRPGSIQSQLQYIFLICCLIQLFIDKKYIKKDDLVELLYKKYAAVTKKATKAVVAQVNQEKKEWERELRKQEERERKEEIREKEREERREKEKEEAKKKMSEVPSKVKKGDKEAASKNPKKADDGKEMPSKFPKKADNVKEAPSKNPKKADDGKEMPSKFPKNREAPSKDARKEEPTMDEAKTNHEKKSDHPRRDTNASPSVVGKPTLSGKEKSKYQKVEKNPKNAKGQPKKSKKKPNIFGF